MSLPQELSRGQADESDVLADLAVNAATRRAYLQDLLDDTAGSPPRRRAQVIRRTILDLLGGAAPLDLDALIHRDFAMLLSSQRGVAPGELLGAYLMLYVEDFDQDEMRMQDVWGVGWEFVPGLDDDDRRAIRRECGDGQIAYRECLRRGRDLDRRKRDQAHTAAWQVLCRARREARRSGRTRPLSGDEAAHPYLVAGLLPAGQPVVLAGPAKSGKTQLAVELGAALATGRPVLGHEVPRPVRVALWSGESGPTTLAGYLRLVGSPAGLSVYPRLPESPHELAGELVARPADVVILDPVYQLIDGDQPSNLFSMGSQYARWGRVCADLGATPVYVHHTVESLKPRGRPALEHLAHAGVKQFARAWLVLNRREPFAPGEPDRLYLLAGGSAGHAELLQVDHTCTPWAWTVRPWTAPRAGDDQGDSLADRVLRVIPPEGASKTWISDTLRTSRKTIKPTLDGLEQAGQVVVGEDGRYRRAAKGL